MSREKKVLQTGLSAGKYLAPKAKVMEVRARRVLCVSDPNGTTSRTEEDDYD